MLAIANYHTVTESILRNMTTPELRISMPERDPVLCRRVEEASLNAWPPMHQVLLDGWLLRFSKGFTKRANSITPLYPALTPTEEKIRYCENLYAREQLKTIFRLISITTDNIQKPSLDSILEQRGYVLSESNLVLFKPLERVPEPAADSVQFVGLEEWLMTYAAITGLPSDAQALHRILLRAIRSETGFAVLHANGRPVACGLGVMDQSFIGLFDIATHPEHRQRGAGAALVSALLHWGTGMGASHAYLQMVSDNAPAARLYNKLGFEPLYHYWYRISS